MKSFTDNAGRIWTVAVNVAAIKRVRAICHVDLNAIVEMDEKNNPSTKLLEKLSTDPVLLVDVLLRGLRNDFYLHQKSEAAERAAFIFGE